jgi:hypothetical protein
LVGNGIADGVDAVLYSVVVKGDFLKFKYMKKTQRKATILISLPQMFLASKEMAIPLSTLKMALSFIPQKLK